MKLFVASIFALLLGAGAANAGGVGVGAHIGGLHLGVGVHGGSHYRHCVAWGGHGHHRYCRRWRR